VKIGSEKISSLTVNPAEGDVSRTQEPHLHLEVGHILFLDIVGYSKLLSDEQKELVQELNQIVRETEHFRAAEAAGKLTRLPTGDGMVLVFTNNPEAPVECALEISKALQSHPKLKVRMGIHSGPVNPVADVSVRTIACDTKSASVNKPHFVNESPRLVDSCLLQEFCFRNWFRSDWRIRSVLHRTPLKPIEVISLAFRN